MIKIRLFFVSLFALVMTFLASTTYARPPDFVSLTDAIDMSTTIDALLFAAAALIGVYILWKGANMIKAAFISGKF